MSDHNPYIFVTKSSTNLFVENTVDGYGPIDPARVQVWEDRVMSLLWNLLEGKTSSLPTQDRRLHVMTVFSNERIQQFSYGAPISRS